MSSNNSTLEPLPIGSGGGGSRSSNGRDTGIIGTGTNDDDGSIGERRQRDGSSVNPASLPADDGMRLLRQRIHEIRDSMTSSDDKARRMHILMTEQYHISQVNQLLRPQSPASILSQDRPTTPTSANSTVESDAIVSSPISSASVYDADNPYNLTAEDKLPSYRIKAGTEGAVQGDDEEDDYDEDGTTLGCQHYKRNVKVQCFDCRRWYPCRHCHDEVEDHRLNRRQTRNMLCMLCSTAQPAAEYCKKCGMRTAWYYCDICKLWDDSSTKKIYHCPDCGICRRGQGIGKDYYHCKNCNVCIGINHILSHRCLERATDCDCPICGEYLFTSAVTVVSMRCGHYMHNDCYNQYMKTAYKCPICKKSAINMELQWRKLDQAIAEQPMPPQFTEAKAVVQCNDCGAKSSTKYHWLGNKCVHCDSYNTHELQLLTSPELQQATLRPCSPARSPSLRAPSPSPITNLAPRNPLTEERRTSFTSTPQPYFVTSQGQDRGRSRTSSMVTVPLELIQFSPSEMLARVNRRLSPLRHYLNSLEGDMGRAARAVLDWDEAVEEDEDDDEHDSSSDDENLTEDDDDDDDDDDNAIELLGHR